MEFQIDFQPGDHSRIVGSKNDEKDLTRNAHHEYDFSLSAACDGWRFLPYG